jgi:sodium/hydrogen antiporter
MDQVSVVVALLGALVLLLGLPSRWLEQTPIPVTLLALLFGVGVGPAALDLFDPARVGDAPAILENVARLALGIGLVGIALRVPREYPRRQWREMLVLVGLGMALMWAMSTALVHLVLGMPLGLAALIGAMITPTDPIAAAPIVTGPVAERNLPERLRSVISFESGANDGLSYLFVFLPLLLLTRPRDDALAHFLLHTLLWEVVVATGVGITIGLLGAWALRTAEEHDLIEGDWRLVYTVALSLLAVGVGRLMGSDELLVAFAAGVAFVQVISAEDRKDEEHGQEAVNRFFSIPIFALFGTMIPWAGWAELGWRGVALAVAVLLLRRPPVLLLLRRWMPGLHRRADAAFVGWFGPIAVAAMYYAVLVRTELTDPRVWHVVSLLIAASVLVHGVSATPLTRLYGRVAATQTELDLADERWAVGTGPLPGPRRDTA